MILKKIKKEIIDYINFYKNLNYPKDKNKINFISLIFIFYFVVTGLYSKINAVLFSFTYTHLLKLLIHFFIFFIFTILTKVILNKKNT